MDRGCVEDSLLSAAKHTLTSQIHPHPTFGADAVELMSTLLDRLHEDLAWQGTTIIDDLFRHVTQVTQRCPNCRWESDSTEERNVLTVRLSSNGPMNLADFFKPRGSEFRCPQCMGQTECTMRLRKLPAVLIIHIARWENSHGAGKKNEAKVTFPDELAVRPWSDIPRESASKYALHSMIKHVGKGPIRSRADHFVAYIQSGHTWFCCNDTEVSKVDLGSVHSQEAYMLLYVTAPGNSPGNLL
jgi:ubiquitin C-terminal hydrolase